MIANALNTDRLTGIVVAILNFPLTVRTHGIYNSPTGLLDPENECSRWNVVAIMSRTR